MRQVHALDFIDPYPTVIRRVKPDENAGWLKIWAESKIVADKIDWPHLTKGGGKTFAERKAERVAEPVGVAAPDGGTWAHEFKVGDRVRVIHNNKGRFAGHNAKMDAYVGTEVTLSLCLDRGWKVKENDWTWDSRSLEPLKPSSPQSSGTEGWVAITADSVLPEMKTGEFAIRSIHDRPDIGYVAKMPSNMFTYSSGSRWYRRIPKQGAPASFDEERGMMAMVGGKDKTRIRNATPPEFRDVLIDLARRASAASR